MIGFFALYVFSTPYFSDRKPFNYMVYAIFALFTVVVLLYRYLFFDFKKTNIRVFTLPLFAIYSSIGTLFFSHQFRYLLTVLLLAMSYVVIYFMLEQVNDNDLVIRVTIYSLSLFVLLFAFRYRHDIINFSNFGSKRLATDNYFDNVNSVAYYFAGCCIFSLYYVLYFKKKISLFFLLPFAASFFLGVLTASRTFLVGVVLSILIIFIIRFRKKPLVLFFGLFLLVITAILLFTLPAFSTLKKRLIDMFNMLTGNGYSTDYSTATRVLWQDYAIFLGSHHLIFGNGLNGFAIYSGTGTYSHANLAETLCNTGVIGLAIYYLTYSIAIYDVINKKMKYSPLVIMLLVFLISREFLGISYTSKFNAVIFAIIMFSGSLGEYKQKIKPRTYSADYYFLEIK